MTWPPKVTQLNISSYYNSREENFIKENSWGKQGCCSVAQLCLTLWLHGLQQARPPCPALSSGVCPNSCPLNQWCYPTISSSDAPFSFCFQSFPASGSFPMSWLFVWGYICLFSPFLNFKLSFFLLIYFSSIEIIFWTVNHIISELCLGSWLLLTLINQISYF